MRLLGISTASLAAAVWATASPAAERPPEGTCRARVVGVHVVNVGGLTQVVLTAEGVGSRSTVDIYVGPNEGAAISRALSGERTPRPMTHDLFASLLAEFGASISRLTISSLEESVFIGKLVIVTGSGERVIDTRPSDGMALAVAAGAPIYISEQVVHAAGRLDDGEEEDEGKEEAKGDEKELPVTPTPFGPPRDLI